MLFNVGDLVKRTHPDYDHMVGVVVEVIDREEVGRRDRQYVPQYVIWVKWQRIRDMPGPTESYWVEDLQVISKYNK